jgi:hypothetical protein
MPVRFKCVEYPVVCRHPFEISRREAVPQPLLCTEQAEKIRARDVPAPKIIVHNKDLRILSHAIAAESLNICPLRVVGDLAHRGA